MKKNLFFGLMALAGLFTSCSQDDAYAPQAADSNQVSMSIGMPADFVKTRAAAPATFPENHKLRCILEVWTQNGATLKVRQEGLVTAGAANITFKFELADQGDYKAVLWADYIASDATLSNGHYTDKYYKTDNASGLKNVSTITSAYTYTDQVREAFTAVVPFTKGATAVNDLTATLVRPLTKVTIAEKNAEMFAKCTSMTAKYTVPAAFFAFDKKVGAATYDATYSGAPMGGVISINGAECKILFSDYVFTAYDGTMGGIELTFTGTGSTTLNNKSIPANIPLKRNNWVRAAGNLITPDYDPNLTMTVDMTTDWVEHDATDIVEAKVGDFYYSDRTWSTTYTNDASNPCIGIVFEVNADGKSGKIVSLDEGTLSWSTFEQETGIDHPSNGAVNTRAVKNWIASVANTDNKTLADFPAFNWCNNISNNDDYRMWYLPAMEELKILATNVDNVNTALTNLGRTTLDTNYGTGCYWSSQEYNSDKQYYAMTLMLDGVKEEQTGKKTVCKVRAIAVF